MKIFHSRLLDVVKILFFFSFFIRHESSSSSSSLAAFPWCIKKIKDRIVSKEGDDRGLEVGSAINGIRLVDVVVGV
jgi:hypothetical protein